MRRRTLPLGVDVGAAHVRVALLERDDTGRARLLAVASRPSADDVAGAVADARRELNSGERRCVIALAAPDAALRPLALPTMRADERRRSARFEAARLFPDERERGRRVVLADVARESRGAPRHVLGVARRSVLDARVAAVRRAGLRPLAVDDTSFALLRALPHASAVVDVGTSATRFILRDEPVPAVRLIPIGHDAVVREVADALGLDEHAARRRVETLGAAGAAERTRAMLIDALASAVIEHRARRAADIASIAIAGNGARGIDLAAALRDATATAVAWSDLGDVSDALPPDVVRAASSDWALAYGLALWETAA